MRRPVELGVGRLCEWVREMGGECRVHMVVDMGGCTPYTEHRILYSLHYKVYTIGALATGVDVTRRMLYRCFL